MEALRQFFKTPAGRVVAIALVVCALGVMFYSIREVFGGNPASATSRERQFICAQTRKSFVYELERGDVIPVKSPYSGANTGYPAELCFWTADGTVKTKPTLVLLNQYAGSAGPTFCPDCKRLVVGHNPPPEPGGTPPPTEEQHTARSKGPVQ